MWTSQEDQEGREVQEARSYVRSREPPGPGESRAIFFKRAAYFLDNGLNELLLRARLLREPLIKCFKPAHVSSRRGFGEASGVLPAGLGTYIWVPPHEEG